MAQPPAKQIFISYRRADSESAAGRLFDSLANHFGHDQIFMDVDNIDPGEDFGKVIDDAIGSCEIVIAVVGQSWLSISDGKSRRLDNPKDLVRLEIGTALKRNIRLIPVLVQGATMPSPQELPEDIQLFSNRHAVDLTHKHWRSDVERLISFMERVLEERKEDRRRREDEEKRRKEEERQRRLADEEQVKQRAAEDKRLAEETERKRVAEEKREKDRQAEKDRASQAYFRDLNSRAREEQVDETLTNVTSEASTHLYKNKRVVLTVGGSVIVLILIVALFWALQKSGDSSTNMNAQSAPIRPQPPAGSIVRNRIGVELVFVPRGEFTMGSENGEADEKPVHQVTIREGFYMGKYEVTQAEWQAVMGNNPSLLQKGDRLPVTHVSWNDAQSFISKLNDMNDGYTYRLPSEAEWEYACRAGTTGDYYDSLKLTAWYLDNSGAKTHPVGQLSANKFGLFDMYGNVTEWCEDWYNKTYSGAPSDGSAWLRRGEEDLRVIRGGEAGTSAAYLGSAKRHGMLPAFDPMRAGLRVVAIAKQ